MPTRSSSTQTETPPSVTPEIGINLLNRLIVSGEEHLQNRPISSVDKSLWENIARDYFKRAFGSDPTNINAVLSAGVRGGYIGQPDSYYENERAIGLTNMIKAVKSVIKILELEIELNGECERCGTKYQKGVIRFCTQCGTPLVSADETSTILSELPTQAFPTK